MTKMHDETPEISEQTTHQERKRIAPAWKWLFWILFACNIMIVACIGSLVLQPSTPFPDPVTPTTSSADLKVATIQSTSDELNPLINGYLFPFQNDTTNYQFVLTDKGAILRTNYSFMGVSMPLVVNFEPVALENGDVNLLVRNISAGSISLPTDIVLAFIKNFDMPSFVEVDSANSQIALRLSQFTFGNDYYVKTRSIDIKEGLCIFDLMWRV
jgi:uncharacterized protein YpmS